MLVLPAASVACCYCSCGRAGSVICHLVYDPSSSTSCFASSSVLRFLQSASISLSIYLPSFLVLLVVFFFSRHPTQNRTHVCTHTQQYTQHHGRITNVPSTVVSVARVNSWRCKFSFAFGAISHSQCALEMLRHVPSTRYPLCKRFRTRCEPTNPVAPMTTTDLEFDFDIDATAVAAFLLGTPPPPLLAATTAAVSILLPRRVVVCAALL